MMNGISRWPAIRYAACALGLLFGAWQSAIAAPGPDVTVFTLSDTANYGVSSGIRGYAVGTVSCNIGTQPLNWCDNSGGCGAGTTDDDHPVIAQNMYRLKNGRFEQIGASWLKHGFLSTNSTNSECAALAGGTSCSSPPLGSNQLGVGCTDPYGSSLNGSRPLGRRSEVDGTTGEFPFPHGGGTGQNSEVWNQRLAVAQVDLDPVSNAGARYFVEGHYIAPDDAAGGNGLNNASWREVSVNASTFNLGFIGNTIRQQAAIRAWATIDPTVELIEVDIPGTNPVQRFHVARKVTEVVPGSQWHYEYVVHNMNANNPADTLEVRFMGNSVAITNAGFRDVNAHSGEPYDTADWPAVTSGTGVSWAAPAFPSNPANANAIRWGTMYSFWFDANQPPAQIGEHIIGMLQGGKPDGVSFWTNIETATFQDGFE